MFGPDRFFGVRAPYEQVASDLGGGAGDPNPGNAGADPSDPGTGSPSGGAPAGDAGTGQPPSPAGLSDEERRDLSEYNRIRQEFGGNVPSKAELDRLRSALRVATGDEPAGAPVDPRTARLRETMLNLFPELKDALELAKRRADIEGVVDKSGEFEAGSKAHWSRHAKSVADDLVSTFASTMLGAGKSAADVTPQQRDALILEFAAYMKGDPARIQRYEAADKSLVTEFLNSKRALWAPVQREAVAGVVARMPSAPGEGASGFAPAGHRPAPGAGAPQSNDDRLDAAVERAFGMVTQAGQ